MSRIQNTFRKSKEESNRIFLPYLCAGDPNLELSHELVLEAEKAGADIIELGIPFSDPLADGPTIQKATQRSLKNGTGMAEVFELVRLVRQDSDIPLVLMTYYNPVFRYGEKRFLDEASKAGADGILVVDLPPEEGLNFYDMIPDYDLDSILLATPTTPSDRVEDLSKLATGFLYYVMVTGVTGTRSGYDTGLAEQINNVGQLSTLPTVVGFGVSDIQTVEDYLEPINGVVAGSYLIEGINENQGNPEAIKRVIHERVSELAEPLHTRTFDVSDG